MCISDFQSNIRYITKMYGTMNIKYIYQLRTDLPHYPLHKKLVRREN
jgi:hypothetical protein